MLNKKNKLAGKEIQRLLFGKTISGNVFGFPWSTNINENGELKHNHITGAIFKGRAWVEGEAVCFQYEKRFYGIKNCAEIYRNAEGSDKNLSEYLELTEYYLFPFSVEE